MNYQFVTAGGQVAGSLFIPDHIYDERTIAKLLQGAGHLTEYRVQHLHLEWPNVRQCLITDASNDKLGELRAVEEVTPLQALRHHVTGAIERGEKEAIVAVVNAEVNHG